MRVPTRRRTLRTSASRIPAPRRRALLKPVATELEEAGEAFNHRVRSLQRPSGREKRRGRRRNCSRNRETEEPPRQRRLTVWRSASLSEGISFEYTLYQTPPGNIPPKLSRVQLHQYTVYKGYMAYGACNTLPPG